MGQSIIVRFFFQNMYLYTSSCFYQYWNILKFIFISRHNQTRRTSSSLRKSTLLIQGDSPPTIDDFDKKLSETDCYLQILLNQVAALKVKIGKSYFVFNSLPLLKRGQALAFAPLVRLEDAADYLQKFEMKGTFWQIGQPRRPSTGRGQPSG